MSKAFTKEDDAGLQPVSTERVAAHAPVTHMGRAVLVERLSAAKAAGDTTAAAAIEKQLAAGTVAPPVDAGVAGLGAEVTVRDAGGRVGDVVEIGGGAEVTISWIAWPGER